MATESLPAVCYRLLELLDLPGARPVANDELPADISHDAVRLCVVRELVRSLDVGNYDAVKNGAWLIFSVTGATPSVPCVRITGEGRAALSEHRLLLAEPPKPADPPAEKPGCAHSDDFRSVTWHGTAGTFTANQARAVEVLWRNYMNNTPDVGDQTLLTAVNEHQPPARLNVLFRDNPAWGTMIVQGGTAGSHRLADSE